MLFLVSFINAKWSEYKEKNMSVEERFEETYDPYLITDNKLYYNINCNGEIVPYFITELDEYSEFRISGKCWDYEEQLPIVMVDGNLKIFLLKCMKSTTDYNNFYIVDEIIISEITIGEVSLADVELEVELGENQIPKKQNIKTSFCLSGYESALVEIREEIDLEAEIRWEYEETLREMQYNKYPSYREAQEAVRKCILVD